MPILDGVQMMDGGWWVVWMIVGVAFWASVGWGVLVALRRRGAERDPEATLRQRFARGEISEAEFERGLTVLRETARRALR